MLLFQALLGFLLNTAVLSGVGFAGQAWWPRLTGRTLSPAGALLAGTFVTVLTGYVAFWCYFLHPLAGRVFSWAVMSGVLATVIGRAWRRHPAPPAAPRGLLPLSLAVGVFYLAVLFLYPGADFATTASERFVAELPSDNSIPYFFADRLYAGQSPKNLLGDWLSSDRPPLQSGLALVALPALVALRCPVDVACATAGVWFQLLWLPAAWVFLRWLGATAAEARAAVAALVFTGFLLLYSVYVWPKLGGAALVLLAFCAFFADEDAASAATRRRRFFLGGALAALGSVAHGGVMFSLLALVPLALWLRPHWWREWLCAAAAFAVLSLPWSAYQRLYEPPGNRLVKWHIAGVIPPDARDVPTALRDSYRQLGWAKAWAIRRHNFVAIVNGDWAKLLVPGDANTRYVRRINESFSTFRTAATWILGLGAFGWLGWGALRGRETWRRLGGRHALAAAWLGLTLAVWLALMFFPSGVTVHQGSLVTQLLLLGLLTMWALLAGRRVFLGLAALAVVFFLLTWMAASPAMTGPVDNAALALAFGAGLCCVATIIWNMTRIDPPEAGGETITL